MSLINLLPQDYYKRRQGRRTNVMCVGLFVVVMGCIVSASMVSRSKAAQTEAVMKNLDRSYNQAAQTISQMQTLKGQKQTILDKRKRIEALQDPVPKSVVLAVLTNARPDGVSLLIVKLDSRFESTKKSAKKLKVKSSKTQATSKTPGPGNEPTVTVDIIGLAQTDFQVARYLANLTDSGLTDSVDLSYTQDCNPRGGKDGKSVMEELENLREFRLKCRLKKNIDARAMARRWRTSGGNDLSIRMEEEDNNTSADKLAGNVPGTEK